MTLSAAEATDARAKHMKKVMVPERSRQMHFDVFMWLRQMLLSLSLSRAADCSVISMFAAALQEGKQSLYRNSPAGSSPQLPWLLC